VQISKEFITHQPRYQEHRALHCHWWLRPGGRLRLGRAGVGSFADCRVHVRRSRHTAGQALLLRLSHLLRPAGILAGALGPSPQQTHAFRTPSTFPLFVDRAEKISTCGANELSKKRARFLKGPASASRVLLGGVPSARCPVSRMFGARCGMPWDGGEERLLVSD